MWKNAGARKNYSPLLGCGPTNCIHYITGKSEFNADMLQSFHLMISDGLAFKNYQERKQYTERVKHLIANSEQRMRGLYKNGVYIPYCCRLSNTLNVSAIDSLPLLEAGMTDKLLLFKASAHEHLPSSSFPRREFEAQIKSELAAYAHFLLNEWKIPANLKETGAERLGFRGYLNPKVLEDQAETSREIILAEILRSWIPVGTTRSDSPGNYYQEMSAFNSKVSKRFNDLCRDEKSFGHRISDLVEATIRETMRRNIFRI
jgi:hypothetical protein